MSLYSVQCTLCSLSLCSVWCTLCSLSLCSVHGSLWSLSLCSVRCSLLSLSLCSVQYPLCSLSLCSVQCPLLSLSLCSLPPLCSGNERPLSLYSLTSKRCTSQSLLPVQPSAVPTILQWMSTAIKLQPSLHSRCCFLCTKFPQSQPQYLHQHLCRPVNIYIMLYNVPL
jgi:hypothetical protein